MQFVVLRTLLLESGFRVPLRQEVFDNIKRAFVGPHSEKNMEDSFRNARRAASKVGENLQISPDRLYESLRNAMSRAYASICQVAALW